jgi:hypothetical protein
MSGAATDHMFLHVLYFEVGCSVCYVLMEVCMEVTLVAFGY